MFLALRVPDRPNGPGEVLMEEIFIPASGMAMEDVLFSEWLKQPGDKVSAGEAVAVIETDKATVELSGLTAGRLSRHLVEAGTRVAAGSTVAFVLAEGESEPGASSAGTGAPLTSPLDDGAGDRQPPARSAGPAEREQDGRHALSPRQRRAMAEAASTGGAQPRPRPPHPLALFPGPPTGRQRRRWSARIVAERAPLLGRARCAGRWSGGRGGSSTSGRSGRHGHRLPGSEHGTGAGESRRGARRGPGRGH